MNKSNYFIDVKTQIFAGMQFAYKNGDTKSNAIRCIGYDITRIYFDSQERDCVTGQQRIKRVLYQH